MLDDHAEISFVEVVVRFHEPGDKLYWEHFDDQELLTFVIGLDEYGEDIQEVIEAREKNEQIEKEAKVQGRNSWLTDPKGWDPDFLVTQPFTSFEFRCFGQNFDCAYSSGLEFEIHSMDKDHVFSDWHKDLENTARELQEKFKSRRMRKDWDGKTVRFVTLWSYHSWEDSYNHEWDSEWELLGLVTPSKEMVS